MLNKILFTILACIIFTNAIAQTSETEQAELANIRNQISNNPATLDLKLQKKLNELIELEQQQNLANMDILSATLKNFITGNHPHSIDITNNEINPINIEKIADINTANLFMDMKYFYGTLPPQKDCPICQNSGQINCSECNCSGFMICRECKGLGKIKTSQPNNRFNNSNNTKQRTCPNCNGLGVVTCKYCLGTGSFECNCSNVRLLVEPDPALKAKCLKLIVITDYITAGGLDIFTNSAFEPMPLLKQK